MAKLATQRIIIQLSKAVMDTDSDYISIVNSSDIKDIENLLIEMIDNSSVVVECIELTEDD